MDKYIVVFKSGAKQEFYSSSVETRSDLGTGQLVEMKINQDGSIRPLYINLHDVSGIFVEKNILSRNSRENAK